MTRSLRAEFGVAPDAKIRLALRFEAGFEAASFLEESGSLIGLLAGGTSPERAASRPEGTVAMVGRGFEAYAYIKESVDPAKLLEKLRRDAEKDEQYAARARAKLANSGFTASAPPEVVAKERDKLEEAERRAGKYRQYIEELS